ncbi:MAG: hypothetical protein ACPGO3_00425 [Magnetospiraceae bacterium]
MGEQKEEPKHRHVFPPQGDGLRVFLLRLIGRRVFLQAQLAERRRRIVFAVRIRRPDPDTGGVL